MLNEEPVQAQDLQMMGMLLPLGIEKGKNFRPDAATVAQLSGRQSKRLRAGSQKVFPNCPG